MNPSKNPRNIRFHHIAGCRDHMSKHHLSVETLSTFSENYIKIIKFQVICSNPPAI